MGSYEKYMTNRLKEEKIGTFTYWNEIRLTEELQQAQRDIKNLQEDMAHLQNSLQVAR